MPGHLARFVVLLFLIIIFLAVGGYYTYMHPKQVHLESCYLNGGSCRELWNCEDRFHSRVLTTCFNKRKICCMPSIQMKSLQDAEDYAE
ncbi:uncharacterized protein [Drosophila suzukii]|uniref:Beta-defensin n=1 Tax=Drosophila suzukii TaxID=28584 RepID=A0AB40A702_DROSZ